MIKLYKKEQLDLINTNILFSQTEELLAKKMLEIPKEFYSEYKCEN